MSPEDAFKHYHQAVYSFAYRLTRREDTAEDITQECFLVLVRDPRRFNPSRGNLPRGWSIGITRPADGNPNDMTVLADPSRKIIFASAYMVKAERSPAEISGALSRAIPMLIGRRTGQTGRGAPHLAQNYAIRPGSEQKSLIGGQQALEAIGEYQENGKPIVELLTWIYSEHTSVFFMTKLPSENIAAVQPVFEQMVRTASLP